MIAPVLCDTSVVLAIMRADPGARQLRSRLLPVLKAISVVTLAELRKGAIRGGWGDRRLEQLDEHIRGYGLIVIEAEVAEVYARLAARCDRLGRPKQQNDLWIAATATRHSLALATLDRAFEDMPGLTVFRGDGTEMTVPA